MDYSCTHIFVSCHITLLLNCSGVDCQHIRCPSAKLDVRLVRRNWVGGQLDLHTEAYTVH